MKRDFLETLEIFLIFFMQPKKGKSSKEVDKEMKFKKIASAALNKGSFILFILMFCSVSYFILLSVSLCFKSISLFIFS